MKYKGDLKGFPKEVVDRMLDCQEEQGNKRDVSVFESCRDRGKERGGFDWVETFESSFFWYDVIIDKKFDKFFNRYPKSNRTLWQKIKSIFKNILIWQK